MRGIVTYAFKRKGFKKQSKTGEIIGCDYNTLKAHIESQFEPWMTWEKHGRYNGRPNYGFEIDHIIPLSSAKTEAELIRLCYYTNLQPLCGYVNRVIKKDRLDFRKEELCAA